MACLLQACSHYEPWSTRALILHEGKRQRKEAALLRKRIPIMIPGDLMCTSAQVCTPMHALSCVRGHTHTHTHTSAHAHKHSRAQPHTFHTHAHKRAPFHIAMRLDWTLTPTQDGMFGRT